MSKDNEKSIVFQELDLLEENLGLMVDRVEELRVKLIPFLKLDSVGWSGRVRDNPYPKSLIITKLFHRNEEIKDLLFCINSWKERFDVE
jgi:hypothetical protein